MLRISVTDQGGGIPEAFRNRIFEQFEQADSSNTRKNGGTGLGLAISKRFVERLDGTISFESEEGVGTSFHIDLPEAAEGNVQASPVDNPPGELDCCRRELNVEDKAGWLCSSTCRSLARCAALGRIEAHKIDRRSRILHVDDDEDILAIISEALGPDVSVTFARTLKDAQHEISSRNFNLVILDIALPDGSGLDLLPDLPPETAVIVFSAEEFDHKLSKRVDAVLTKTKVPALDVAKLVASFLPAVHSGARSGASAEGRR